MGWGAGSAPPGRAVVGPCQPFSGSPWGKSQVDPTRSQWDPARSSLALSRSPCDAAPSTIAHWLSISRDPAGISTEPGDDLTPSWQGSSKVAAPTFRYRSTPYESTSQVYPALGGSLGIQRVSPELGAHLCLPGQPHTPAPTARAPAPSGSHSRQIPRDPAPSRSRSKRIPLQADPS